MPDSPGVFFVTLGCPKNEVDSDRMIAAVDASAYHLASDLDAAGVAVVNTCAFIQPAVEEAIETILELVEWRDARSGRYLIVAGCLPSRYGSSLHDELTEPDAFLPVSEEGSLLKILETLTGVPAGVALGSERTRPGPSAYLQITDGCFRSCSYCTIPSIRGPYRSRPLPELHREAANLIAAGAREIVLIGQDTGAYGRDSAEPETLPDLLHDLSSIDGLDWLRLMYLQPDGITEKLLDAIAHLDEVCAYVDMPLQHVSPEVLRRMHRRGSAEEYLQLIERMRDRVPGLVLRSSFIAGFPGETEQDVRDLVEFLEQAAIDYVGVFPYWPEEGTPAAELPGLPSLQERQRRAQLLRDAADEIGFGKAEALIGSTLDVLAEGLDDDGAPVGRWRGQAPDVDGVVMLDKPVAAGTITSAKITDAMGYDLEAEIQQ